MEKREFKVLFVKESNKKRKIFQDGTLKIQQKQVAKYSTSLFSDTGEELAKRDISLELFRQISPFPPASVTIGQFEIQVEDEIIENGVQNICSKGNNLSSVGSDIKKASIMQTKRYKMPFAVNKNILNAIPAVTRPALACAGPIVDNVLESRLKPHQLEAVNFLYDTLQRQAELFPDNIFEDRDASSNNIWTDNFNDDVLTTTNRITGAILADEMGLGKTLTSLCVMWKILQNERCKAVIVCPSSLIDNWEKEIRKWLGSRLVPLCAHNGSQAEAAVDTFRVGHLKQSPVLIISYEMFRKHVITLNQVNLFKLLLCDEAHRLKNINETKTTLALSGCRAVKRLILTGTPIQNDLEELYAVVSFAQPGLLGSLSNFRAVIQEPMLSGAQSHATEFDRKRGAVASTRLKDILSKIMIRRTQQEILCKSLPPCTVTTVMLSLSVPQKEAYDTVVRDICCSVGIGMNAINNFRTPSSCMEDHVLVENVEDDNQDSGSVDNDDKDDVDLDSDSDDVSADNDSRTSDVAVKDTLVLPGLQKLRLLCNQLLFKISKKDEKEKVGQGHPYYSSTSINTKDNGDMIENVNTMNFSRHLQSSSKLQLLDAMLSYLWTPQTCPPSTSSSTSNSYEAMDNHHHDKVVVVSSFTSTLDLVALLAEQRGWTFMRLDGQVIADKRQSLVDAFNRSSDTRKLFLLSAKAGGVGINLIGGNRLIMLDCDWNPAIDNQAMARIWREGQRKPVFVYRFVADCCIEEAILRRQHSKSQLADMVGKQEQEQQLQSLSSSNTRKKKSEKSLSLSFTKEGLKELLFPKMMFMDSHHNKDSSDDADKIGGIVSNEKWIENTLKVSPKTIASIITRIIRN